MQLIAWAVGIFLGALLEWQSGISIGVKRPSTLGLEVTERFGHLPGLH
jgi:hypothetical protein